MDIKPIENKVSEMTDEQIRCHFITGMKHDYEMSRGLRDQFHLVQFNTCKICGHRQEYRKLM